MGRLESFNPATGALLGTVETVRPEDIDGIVESVEDVQMIWRELTLKDRAEHFEKAARILAAEAEQVARLISAEQGKPITEAYTMEVIPAIDSLAWVAEAGQSILNDDEIKMGNTLFFTKKSDFSYEPVGVVGVISPSNFPWSIPFAEVVIALMAGNGVVLKPATETPLLAQKMASILSRAGIPEGLFRVVHGGGAVGQALVESPVRKVFFTGSVEVGRMVAETCASLLKGVVLELGGKDAAIVCADANLANAVSGIAWGGFANAGQTCSGVERVYVVEEVADYFTDRLVEAAEELRLGDPQSWEVEVGPMLSPLRAEQVGRLIDSAVEDGAELLCGGPTEVEGQKGSFFAPAVLVDVNHKMKLMKEEVFGPVLAIVKVANEEEAIELANESEFGLGASVWTEDRRKGERMARRIESGMVWINDHSYSHGAIQTPWGGMKNSGIGRSHSKFGFYECVDIKLVSWEPGHTRNFWWYPYDSTLGEAIRSAAGLLFGGSGARIRALREGGGSMLRTGARNLRRARRDHHRPD